MNELVVRKNAALVRDYDGASSWASRCRRLIQQHGGDKCLKMWRDRPDGVIAQRGDG
jgi:hypothetical protein